MTEDTGKRLGDGFGTFTYTNDSDDNGGDKAGFTPSADVASPAVPIDNWTPIPTGQSKSATPPDVSTYPREMYVWIEPGTSPQFWKCWKLTFDKPVQSCSFTNKLGFQQIGQPGGCEVSALAEDGTSAQMVGMPQDIHTGHGPPS